MFLFLKGTPWLHGEVNHSPTTVIKLPLLAATSELSLQMVSGCSQWLIGWLIGAPIKARGMLEPLENKTQNRKSFLYSHRYQGLPKTGGGGLTFDTSHPHYCTGNGQAFVMLWHVAREAHRWIPHSWLVSTLTHNAWAKGFFFVLFCLKGEGGKVFVKAHFAIISSCWQN